MEQPASTNNSTYTKNFTSGFWSEKFWLPENYTWDEINSPPGQRYPDAAWLLDGPFKWSLSLLIIRFLFETVILEPIGRWWGVDEKFYIPCESNKQLSKHFYSGKRDAKTPTATQLKVYAQETGWSVIRCRNWFFLKRKHTSLSDMRKFCGAIWRFIFYTVIFIQGIKSVFSKAWIWDPMPYAIQWPLNQFIEDDVHFYFSLQFAFYMNLLWAIWIDIPRDAPDFYPMLLHHVVTLGLDYFGFAMNAHRVAAAIHVLHDPADVVLELAKASHYVKKSQFAQKMSNALFVLFAAVWVITRNIMFPVLVLFRVIFIVPRYTGFCWAMLLTNTMMLTVFALQVYWSFLIWRVALRALRSGKGVQEAASDAEDELFDTDRLLQKNGAEQKNGVHQQKLVANGHKAD